MADIEYSTALGGEAEGEGLSWRGLVNGMGAVASLALVVGLGWWGYQTLRRDVAGVPVIRALEGPMRVAPDDPGGSKAEYQGLAVNSIPAKGAADAPADRLVLAPGPTQLRAEDRPAAELEALARRQEAASAAPAAPTTQAAPPSAPAAAEPASPPTGGEAGAGATAPMQPAPAQPVAAAPAPAAPAPAEPEPAEAAGHDAAPAADIASVIEQTLREVTASEASEAAAPAGRSGLWKVRRPVPRPAGLAAASASATPAAPAAPARPVVNRMSPAGTASAESAAARTVPAPVSLPAGTVIAHLGSFQSSADAETAWKRMALAVTPLMGADRRHVILRKSALGGVVYRLSVTGFSNRAEVNRFCAALEGQVPRCIPFTVE